jgi:hypothetical protein
VDHAQLTAEIEERQAFISEMRRLGQSKKHELVIEREIEERAAELTRLTAELQTDMRR